MKKTTLCKHINKLSLLLFIVFSINSNGQDIVFSADFAQLTNGNNTGTTGSSTPWAGDAIFPAAGVARAFEAGGAVRIGTGSQTGFITTAPDDYSEVDYFTIYFDVKGWTTVEGDIKVILITQDGQSEQVFTYDATMASPLFDFVEVSYPGGGSNVAVRIETTAKRAFIDNLLITTADCGQTQEPTPVAQSFCGAATVSDLMPNGANINWYSSATADTPLSTTDALVTQTYYVSQVANEGVCESDRVPVSIAVNPIPQAPTAGPQAVCHGETILNLAANGTDLQWYTEMGGGDALAPGEELASATYYVSQTVNGCESARTAVDISVNSVGVPQAVPQTFCQAAIVEDLNAVGANVLWYTSSVGGAALDPSEGIVEGIYYATQTVGGCESERVSVSVEIIEVDMPAGEALQQYTTGQTLADLTLTGANIMWFSDSALVNELPSDTILTDGMTYYAVATEGMCQSAPFTVTVDDALGNNEFLLQGVRLYPNPVNHLLRVSFTEPLSNVTIYNLLGQQVLHINAPAASVEIDVSRLSSGTYVVKVESGKMNKIFKIVKS